MRYSPLRIYRAILFDTLLTVLGILLTIPVAAAQSYLFNQATYTTGAQPVVMITGDFNGGGALDLVTANQVDNTVSILLAKANGTFAAKVDYPAGGSPNGMVAADFNGDGRLDLAVTNQNSGTVSILFGNGDGSFQSPISVLTGRKKPLLRLAPSAHRNFLLCSELELLTLP